MSQRGLSPERALEIVTAAVESVLRHPVVGVRPEHELEKDLGFDSLHFVEVIAEIEAVARLQIADVDAVKAKTVADLTALLTNFPAKPDQ